MSDRNRKMFMGILHIILGTMFWEFAKAINVYIHNEEKIKQLSLAWQRVYRIGDPFLRTVGGIFLIYGIKTILQTATHRDGFF